MSTPIRRDDRYDDPWLYVPPWARERVPVTPRRPRLIDSPPMAPGIDGPNIDLPPPRVVPFEGDLGIRELRRRLSLDPDIVPNPPIRMRSPSVLPLIFRLSFLVMAAALSAYIAVMVPWTLPEFPAALKQDRGAGPPAVREPFTPAKLLIENRQAFANEPLQLGVGLSGSGGGEAVLLSGLASGTRLSAGGPQGTNGWRVPVHQLGGVLAFAPKDFVGVMEPSIDLRTSGDALVDRNVVRLAWIAKPATPKHEPIPEQAFASQSQTAKAGRQPDAEELAMLIRRGQEFLKTGDIAAARLMFRRAAQFDNAQATLSLGATFDPTVLLEIGVLGFAPDVTQARNWYQKAAALGSAEASRRIERLPAQR